MVVIHVDIVVSGEVQHVGFRYSVQQTAHKLGLTGHVKNMDDGTVEIACEGNQDAIDSLIEAMRALKSPITVTDVQTKRADMQGFDKFIIIPGELIQEMMAGFVTGSLYLSKLLDKSDEMLGKQDQMLDKQDQMLDKQDQMLDKQDQMIDKQDQMLDKQDQMLDKQDQMIDKQDQMIDKQDQTISEIRAIAPSLGEIIDSRFQKLEKDVSEIKSILRI